MATRKTPATSNKQIGQFKYTFKSKVFSLPAYTEVPYYATKQVVALQEYNEKSDPKDLYNALEKAIDALAEAIPAFDDFTRVASQKDIMIMIQDWIKDAAQQANVSSVGK